jgi:ketosteroid isomerase-like protein
MGEEAIEAPRPALAEARYCEAMSQENVERARAFIEAYNRRDFDAAVEDFDPQIDWVLPARQSSDNCRGPDEVKEFWRSIDETFDEFWLDPQEFVDAGDRIATRLRHAGRSKIGIEIDTELYHQVATFKDGRIVRMEYFAEWDEALAAAKAEE